MKRGWCPGLATRVPLNSPREPPEWCRSAHAAISMTSVPQQCFQAAEGTSAGRRGGHPGDWPRRGQTPSERPRNTAAALLTSMTAVPSVLGRGPRHGLGTSTARHGFSGARFAQVVSGLSDHLRRLLPLLYLTLIKLN